MTASWPMRVFIPRHMRKPVLHVGERRLALLSSSPSSHAYAVPHKVWRQSSSGGQHLHKTFSSPRRISQRPQLKIVSVR